MTPAAVILAGSRPGAPDPVAAVECVAHKALVDVAGAPMLERVAGALHGAGIERILVATNDRAVGALAGTLDCEVLPAAEGPSASVALAFERTGAPLLVTTSDHALLDGQWIEDFLADRPDGCDVAILLAPRAAIERAQPGSRRTYLRFADGDWSGCNLFLLATPHAGRAIETWKQVEANRKRPWRIAARLGLGTLWRYVRGTMTADEAIARLAGRIGLTGAVVAARDGLAAVDVDKPEDLADVRRILAERAARERVDRRPNSPSPA